MSEVEQAASEAVMVVEMLTHFIEVRLRSGPKTMCYGHLNKYDMYVCMYVY